MAEAGRFRFSKASVRDVERQLVARQLKNQSLMLQCHGQVLTKACSKRIVGVF